MSMTPKIRGALMATVSAAGLLASANGALADGASAEAAVAAAAPQTSTVGEIIVTAQRRSENLQDVPVAETAATGSQLATARVANIENIQTLSPSISFRSTNFAASTGNIQIRGIGTVGVSRSFEGAVGVFIDGVYRTRSGQALSDFLDIDSLEILRGPQGTLFGKNTSAGALLLTSNRPNTSAFGGEVEADFGDYDYHLVKAAVNLPVNDEVAIRVAALNTDHQGYISNPEGTQHYNETPDTAVKAQILFKPTDKVTALLIGDYAKTTGNCCFGTVSVLSPPGITSLVNLLTTQAGLTVPSTDISKMQAQVGTSTSAHSEDYGGTLKLDYDVGPGALHSITAVRRYSAFQNQDATFSGANILPLDESFDSRFWSQEVTYSGKLNGALSADYIFGAYYSHEDLAMARNLNWGSQAQEFWTLAGLPFVDAAPGLFSREVMGGTAQSASVFTHWDVRLSDHFNLIAGVRYGDDRKTGSFSNPFFRDPVLDPLAVVGVMPGIRYDAKTSNDSVSGTAVLQYHLSHDAMIYAGYSRGVKAGGVNMDVNAAGTPGSSLALPGFAAVVQNPVFKPETDDAFEAGAKIDWLDGHARTNGAIFYNKLTNLQVAQFVGLQFAVLNAPSADVSGAEVEQIFKLNEEVTLNGAVTWLPQAKYGDSPVLNYLSGGTPSTLSGRRFTNTPKVAATLSASLVHPIGHDLSITGRIEGEYQGKVFTSSSTDLTQGGYGLMNLNLGLKSAKGWSVELWAQNVTDTHYVTFTFPTPILTGIDNAYIGPPRTFGVALRGKF